LSAYGTSALRLYRGTSELEAATASKLVQNN